MGCHNINWVSPTHLLAAIGRALESAAGRGLRLPIVYNTNGYDSLEALELLEGVVDIYMPDLKYANEEVAERLSEAPGYVTAARAAIREMHRQVGSLALDKEGIARRGLLIRHLVMPEDLSGTFDTLTWIAETLGRDTTVNLMAQYHPAHRAYRHPDLGRRVTWEEYGAAVDRARSLGLRNLLIQG
jgi:putative pyruvate formate lyase activating enzyme